MKRRVSLFILFILALSLLVVPSYSEQEIRVSVDGGYISFDVQPTIIDGRVLVPLRAIFEALDVIPVWHSSTKTVTAEKDSRTIELTIDSYQAKIDGEVVEIDVPGTIVDGRTIVPARFIAEALDAEVLWDAVDRIVIINSSEYQAEKQLNSLDFEQISQLSESVVKIYVENINGGYFSGSGFFYEDGKIGTNYHVIEDAEFIKVEFDDRSFYTEEIKVIGYNKELDLAALSIANMTISGLQLGDSEGISVGQSVYAIGSPGGVINTVSSGVISAIRNQMIQITAPISPGSSGGVLIDEYGDVIGVTSLGIIDKENVGYAIPINLFKSMDKDANLSLSEFRDASDSLENNESEEANYKNLAMARLEDGEAVYTDTFSTDTPYIYATGMLYNASGVTKLKSEWYYLEKEEFIDSVEVETEESNAEFYFSLSMPDTGWPKGFYEVRLFIDGEYQESLEFKVE
ncbi:MAG: stalk domain-containing protein [Clostridia bacterium]